MIEMKKLREILEEELLNHDLRTELRNQADDKLDLRVSKLGYKSHLSIHRQSYNPQEVEVTIDFSMASKRDVIRSFRPGGDGGTGLLSGDFRWMWLLLLFVGAIFSLLFAIVGLFTTVGKKLTLGWTDNERLLVILGLVAILAILWLYLLPRVKKRRIQGLKKFDSDVLAIVLNRLINLNEEMNDSTLLRCWSCFEIIDPKEKVCTNCGVEQK
jgi:hypothetical protein